MDFSTNAYSVTTALMMAFAVFVIFIRMKNWVHNSVPLIFYAILIPYMAKIDGTIPLWLMLAGLGLTMLLRFEFMNERFIGFVKTLEILVLGAIIYFGLQMILA